MKLLLLLWLVSPATAALWLPFANLGSMLETLKEAAFRHSLEANEDHNAGRLSILEFGKELLNGIGKFLSSSFDETEKINIANGLREIFNVTTPTTPSTSRRIPKIHPVTDTPRKKFTFPYTTPNYFTTSTTMKTTTSHDPRPDFLFSTTEQAVIKFSRSTTPGPITTSTVDDGIIRFTTSRPLTSSGPRATRPNQNLYKTWARLTTTPATIPTTTFTPPTANLFTAPTATAYPIWPTTSRRTVTWKPVTPEVNSEANTHTVKPWLAWKNTPFVASSTSTPATTTPAATTPMTMGQAFSSTEQTTEGFDYTTVADLDFVTSTAAIPHIVKSRKFTRPPILDRMSFTTASPNSQKCEICKPGQRCNSSLRSFETSDPFFQYCYSHSTMIDESMQDLLRDTQTTSFPSHVSWHQSVPPEVLQLVQTIIALYRPSRCLVIGVFTGLGLLGIAEHVDSRGIVVALEHPGYAVFWERVGQKHAKRLSPNQMSRIQVRNTESIEKSLPRLAIKEPNTFDFVFLDDFKRDNYLDDYEHAVRLLRNGGLLVINQALNGGGVLSGVESMTSDDRVIRNMNIRIKQDARVRASLLPYGGGTWIISKK